ncbi:MAG TPA: type II secretion system F family protein [Patescibacteria group bacterium]|nr:type II secretion system F family protein [Patescibacteria group bacterium]
MMGGKKNSTAGLKRNTLFRKISTVDKIFLVQNLAVLIKAGFSLANALTTVAKQTKQQWLKETITTIATDIQSGQTFADALRRYEKIFDALFINMIEAGELSGKLEITLKELSVQLKKSHSLYLKVRNALAYPAVILTAMIGIGTGMMIFVIPKIMNLYAETSFQLPLATRIVIAVSNFIIHHGILSLLMLIGIITVCVLLYKQQKIKLFIHQLLVHMPLFGNIIREYNLARFSRIFHSLISTDIPVIRIFEIIANTLGNIAYKQYMQLMIPQLERGVSIGEAIGKDAALFPPTVVEMIIVAEASGSLEEMTNDIAIHYEEEVSSTLDGLSVLIEPVLMLILGAAIGLIAVAILWPMYNLVNVI